MPTSSTSPRRARAGAQLLDQLGVAPRAAARRRRRGRRGARSRARRRAARGLRASASRAPSCDAARAAPARARPAAGADPLRRHHGRARPRASSASRRRRRCRAHAGAAVGPQRIACSPRSRSQHGGRTRARALSVSRVRFAPLGRRAIDALRRQRRAVRQGRRLRDPGRAPRPSIERIEGSYSGIMGLPLYETAALLRVGGRRRPALTPESPTSHARHPDQLVAAGNARRRRRERRGAGAARRAHARARPGRQHLPRQGRARAARHAVGLHRHRPRARRLPARRRHPRNGGTSRGDHGPARCRRRRSRASSSKASRCWCR